MPPPLKNENFIFIVVSPSLTIAGAKLFRLFERVSDRFGAKIWHSAKRAGVKRVCLNKAMAHIWFMHDAHLGRAFLFLDMLAECTLLSMTVMVTPCLWCVVGMKLVCPMASFLKPLLHAPLLANSERSGVPQARIQPRCVQPHILGPLVCFRAPRKANLLRTFPHFV